MEKQWFNMGVDEALSAIDSRHSGLSTAEAHARIAKYGLNELRGRKKPHPALLFLRQFLSPLIYVLIVAVIISIVVGHYVDAGVIMGVLLLNATVGFVQESRAEKAMEALIQMAAPKAKVRRDGVIKQIPARDIVPGDIIFLETGDRVPADTRLVDVSNLKIIEAALTGESMPVEKHSDPLNRNVAVAERRNMAYMGTIVSYGRAAAVAVRTGMETEIGRIASAIQEVAPEQTPLQKSIGRLSRYLVIIFMGVIGVLVAAGLARGLDRLEVFLLAVAAAVSAIPEGLPAVVTVVLSIGMRTMARRNAIIRRLVAVETLGSATVICSDKTGTLTMNEMTVRRLYLDNKWIEVSGEGYEPKGEFRYNGQVIGPRDNEILRLHLRIGTLCNDALLTNEDNRFGIYGDPTEGALLVAAAKAGLSKERLERSFPRLDEIPFQSEKQYMATLHHGDGCRVAYIKGAPEKLLALSKLILSDKGVVPLGEADRERISKANNSIASEAMRVIATAYLELLPEVDDIDYEDIKTNLVFVGLYGMADPPREEVKSAIKLCQEAGIKVVMITGDHKITAESIARQLDLPPGETVTGTELQQMSDEELYRRIEAISVFARIEPLHKLRIVNAYKKQGEVVAMTGDGVNDAPALKSANIGIAMGITGTDVAKEASDMVLADDNFTSVVAAVEEGRAVFNRLRSVIFFLLTTNIGELLALTLSVFFIGQAPLLAVQIIWNNLVTDTAVAVPLGMEPKFGDELKQPPRHPAVGLIYPGLILRVVYMSLMMGLAAFFIFRWASPSVGLEEARTLVFASMAIFEWFKALNARSDEYNIIKMGIFRNRLLVLSILVAASLQLGAIYTPFGQTAFSTVPLSAKDWGIALVAGLGIFLIEETRKTFFPKLFSLGKWRPLRQK